MLTRCNFLFFSTGDWRARRFNGGQTTTSLHELFFQDTLKRAGKYMEISTLEGINTQNYTVYTVKKG